MPWFEEAFAETLKHEGGYANHPDDAGGETIYGIARKHHPDWPGWKKIDTYKTSPVFPAMLETDVELQEDVKNFYWYYYWSQIEGEHIRFPQLAMELFDQAVHLGTKRAVRFLQIALNILNRKGSLYPDVTEDGVMGPKTLHALEQYQSSESPAFLIKALVLQRGAFYIDAVHKREASESFIRGWLRRVQVR